MTYKKRISALACLLIISFCSTGFRGKPIWIYKLGQRVEEATLCIYRDKVYVLAGDGYVHAIE